MSQFNDLSGKQFGIWKVLTFDHTKMYHYGKGDHHGVTYYKCQCTCCGRTFIRSRYHLLQKKNVRHHGTCLRGGEHV